MGKRTLRGGAIALPLAAIALVGCPNPNMYQTPRTTPAGHFQHVIALEGAALSGQVQGVNTAPPGSPSNAPKQDYSVTYPMFPSYGLRYGLGDRFDMGFRITNLSALGFDFKWNFLRSKVFDIAIDPGGQLSYLSVSSGNASESIFLFYGHLPLVFGINAGDSVTFVPTIGATYTGVSSSVSSGGQNGLVTASGVTMRGSFGIQLRVSKKFAFHPEVSVMRLLGDFQNTYIVFGLGLDFGTLPSYGDDAEEEEEKKDDEKKPAPPSPPADSSRPPESNGPPPVLAPVAPVDSSKVCPTTCDAADGSSLSADDRARIATTVEPLMHDLRACLDRVGAQKIKPKAFLRISGASAGVRLDLGGYENLGCVQDAQARNPLRFFQSFEGNLTCNGC